MGTIISEKEIEKIKDEVKRILSHCDEEFKDDEHWFNVWTNCSEGNFMVSGIEEAYNHYLELLEEFGEARLYLYYGNEQEECILPTKWFIKSS